MIKTRLYSFLLLVSLLAGCLSSVANEGLKQAQKTGEPLFISEVSLIATNFTPVQIAWYNPGPKTIEQVGFAVSTFNQEGEKVHETQLISNGPHLPMDEKREESPVNRIWWIADWYHPAMTCILIDKIEITFEDGAVLAIDSKEQLDKLIADDVVKKCQK